MKNRTQHTIENTEASIVAQIFNIVTSFVLRTIFIRVLGIQYAGVSGLFTSILTALSLAELGIGSAITFSLYKPISEKDIKRISQYMNFYKNAYRLVAMFILIGGSCIIPFLGTIVKEVPDIDESIVLIYFLFLINSVISYLFVYKSVLLTANQEDYKISLLDMLINIGGTILKSILIFIFHNYILYLLVNIGLTITRNAIISLCADKEFKEIKNYNDEKLSLKERKRLYQDIGALAMYSVAGVVLGATDNIIISVFINTSMVGIIANYKLIASSIDTFLNKFYSAVTPSIGNLAAENGSGEVQYSIFNKANFLGFWLTCFCTTSLFVLMDSFIGTIWLGKEFILPGISIALVIDFYVTNMVRPIAAFRTANGLFIQGKWRPIIMAVINIILSILFAKVLGVIGVILATSLSRIVTQVWFDPWLVYRKVFKISFRVYWISYFKYVLITFLSCIITNYFSSIFVLKNPFLLFGIKMLFCLIIPNVIIYLLFRKTEEMKYLTEKISGTIKKVI